MRTALVVFAVAMWVSVVFAGAAQWEGAGVRHSDQESPGSGDRPQAGGAAVPGELRDLSRQSGQGLTARPPPP